MDNNAKKINVILVDFLQNEAAATDARIIAIRRFIAVLQEAVDKYFDSEGECDPAERDRLSRLIDDMAEIYRQEISALLVKRGKLSEYIGIVRTETATKNIAEAPSANAYLN